jgi:regulatory protein
MTTMTTETSRAKDKALRLLAMRDHSAYELRNKLRQKLKITEPVWEEVLAFLKGLGFLVAETELTARWVKQWRSEGRGRYWISGKLKSKGLPQASLSDNEDEVEAARQMLRKKLRTQTLKGLSLKEKAKISRSLISRGFSSSVVAIVINDRL